jgi:transposase, IS6 family
MKQIQSSFKWRHFEPTIIRLCVRWYCRYQLSYRELEEMMGERGLPVDHTTVFRWVQRYAPETNKRMRPHLKLAGTSYRSGETYVKVGQSWKYLYRAVDKEGNTSEFMLSSKRDVFAAKRFFKRMMRAEHRRLPFTIGVEKHASYPEAFATSVKEKVLPSDCKLRRVKYRNNVIEQDHRFVRRRWRACQCLRLISYDRASAGGDRSDAYDEEGAGEKVRRQRCGGAGVVRRQPVRGGRIDRSRSPSSYALSLFLQHNPLAHQQEISSIIRMDHQSQKLMLDSR